MLKIMQSTLSLFNRSYVHFLGSYEFLSLSIAAVSISNSVPLISVLGKELELSHLDQLLLAKPRQEELVSQPLGVFASTSNA